MTQPEFINMVAKGGMFRALWVAQYYGVAHATVRRWVKELIVRG